MIMAGRRNTRAEFQERIDKKDAAGESIESWRTVYRSFVSISSLGADKQFDESVNYQVSQFELTAQYSKKLEREVTTSHRVLLKGKPYRITSIGDVFSRKTLSYTIEIYE